MIEIKEVQTRKQKKEFVEFPLNLYKGCEYFVPPLYSDEMKLFKPNHMYHDQSKSVFYNAYKDGKMVGRIQGILQLASNAKWNQSRVRFTRFDSINDQEVANALFKALEEWAKSQNMNELVGPLGFSDLEREGLLIEGFNELSTFEEQYNYDYYQQLIENVGFVKEVDWVERKLYLPDEIDPRLEHISQTILAKNELKLVKAKNASEFIKKYGDDFFKILDETYVNIYGTVPFTEEMKKSLISSFKLIVNVNNVALIVDKNDKPVCFGLCFPSIGKALQKSGGRLTIPAVLKLLKAIKHPNIIDLGLIGVADEYKRKGVTAVLITGILNMLKQEGVEYAETNLNLEDNLNIQNQWKHFKSVLHKRRRCFVKEIA